MSQKAKTPYLPSNQRLRIQFGDCIPHCWFSILLSARERPVLFFHSGRVRHAGNPDFVALPNFWDRLPGWFASILCVNNQNRIGFPTGRDSNHPKPSPIGKLLRKRNCCFTNCYVRCHVIVCFGNEFFGACTPVKCQVKGLYHSFLVCKQEII